MVNLKQNWTSLCIKGTCTSIVWHSFHMLQGITSTFNFAWLIETKLNIFLHQIWMIDALTSLCIHFTWMYASYTPGYNQVLYWCHDYENREEKLIFRLYSDRFTLLLHLLTYRRGEKEGKKKKNENLYTKRRRYVMCA